MIALFHVIARSNTQFCTNADCSYLRGYISSMFTNNNRIIGLQDHLKYVKQGASANVRR
jgi:hypothetical protein